MTTIPQNPFSDLLENTMLSFLKEKIETLMKEIKNYLSVEHLGSPIAAMDSTAGTGKPGMASTGSASTKRPSKPLSDGAVRAVSTPGSVAGRHDHSYVQDNNR